MDSDDDILDLGALDDFEDVFDNLTIDPRKALTVRFDTIIEEHDDLLDELPPDSLRLELQPTAKQLKQPDVPAPFLASSASDISGWKQKPGSFRQMLEARKKKESQERDHERKLAKLDSAVSIHDHFGSKNAQVAAVPLSTPMLFTAARPRQIQRSTHFVDIFASTTAQTQQPQATHQSTVHKEEATSTVSSTETTPRKLQSRIRPPTPAIHNRLAYIPFDKSRTPSANKTVTMGTTHSRALSDARVDIPESPVRAIGRKYAGSATDTREDVKYRRTNATADQSVQGKAGVTPSRIAVRVGSSITPVKRVAAPVVGSSIEEIRRKYTCK